MWFPTLGIGYYPVRESQATYGAAYFERYQQLAKTPMSAKLNDARNMLLKRHWSGPVVDIGIGSGAFIESHPDAYGYDINQFAVDWLRARKRYVNPYMSKVPAITCWDSLEHIADFVPLLERVTEWVFVSLPIFSCAEEVLSSKHFRPDEHFWYFTAYGLIRLMAAHGFVCAEYNTAETEIGRESIGSFAFRRCDPLTDSERVARVVAAVKPRHWVTPVAFG